jgi:hypothetical protein
LDVRMPLKQTIPSSAHKQKIEWNSECEQQRKQKSTEPLAQHHKY